MQFAFRYRPVDVPAVATLIEEPGGGWYVDGLTVNGCPVTHDNPETAELYEAVTGWLGQTMGAGIDRALMRR